MYVFFFGLSFKLKKKQSTSTQIALMTSAETDVAVFQNIANPAKVASSPRPSLVNQEDDGMSEFAESEFSNMFDNAVKNAPDKDYPEDASTMFSDANTPPAAPPSFAHASQIPEEPPPSAQPASQEPFDYNPSQGKMDQAFDGEDLEMEKQAVLMEIDDLRRQGLGISKNFTMDDSLESMQFEVRRHLAHLDEVRMVGMLTEMFKLALTGLEMGSKKFKLLDLDGYSAEVTSDMSRFTPSLTRLYRKYYRKAVWSPEAELGFALCSSVAMFHFRRSFYSGDRSSASQSNPGAGMPNPFNFGGPPPRDQGRQSNTTDSSPHSSDGNAEAPPPSFF